MSAVRAVDNADLENGLATLEGQSVDFVITDPTYEQEAHELGRRQSPTYDGSARSVDAALPFAPMDEGDRKSVSREIGRVSRVGAVVFCQVEAAMAWRDALESAGLTYRRTIPWVKPDAMPSLHGRWPGQSFEVMVLALRRGATVPVGGKARYYECTRERGEARVHPTAKPLALMRQIVEDFTLPGQLVLDPYAGSGTTGVACRILGRRFMGYERNVEMADIANRRLAGARAVERPWQPELFV